MEDIVNKVAKSSLISFDLKNYLQEGERVVFDLKNWLFQGMILREKDFRQAVKDHNWSAYEGKFVAVTCSVDAIVPTWAYMLIATKLEPHARLIIQGDSDELEKFLFQQSLQQIDASEFEGAKMVIKGCSDIPVPEFAYMEIIKKFKPVVSSIMYGEPCSTVPVYKAPKK